MNKAMESIIVSRHPAAIEFLRDKGIDSPVIEHATENDVRGKRVYGNVPLHLASVAFIVIAIEFTGDPPRGREYSVEDMKRAGAQLVEYKVVRVRSME